jgi:peptidyl-prolyl cis-trans isomerase B (cyclophilin B)
MAVYVNPWRSPGARRVAAGLILGLALVGCGQQSAQAPPPAQDATAATPAAAAGQPAAPQAPPVDPRFQRSFAEATRQDPPGDYPPPPDLTLTGKSVGKLYTSVVETWDSIRFVSPAGKRLVYHAVLDTTQGLIDIELRPDWAPNHVRNFIALARVGYYDGLVFERAIHQVSPPEVKPEVVVDLVEGGCPLGIGDPDQASLGYWLKPEFNAKVQHEEGVVGACRGEEPDSAACRFYVTLSKAPILDGSYTLFGKVARGLDVARKIFAQPVNEDESEGGIRRPANPVVIRKVTIETKEVDKPGPGGDN